MNVVAGKATGPLLASAQLVILSEIVAGSVAAHDVSCLHHSADLTARQLQLDHLHLYMYTMLGLHFVHEVTGAML